MRKVLDYIEIIILIALIIWVSIGIYDILAHPKPTIKYVKNEVPPEPVVLEVVF